MTICVAGCVLAGIVGLTVSSVVADPGQADDPRSGDPIGPSPDDIPASYDFPRNSSGQTYGDGDLVAPSGWPDLLAVQATNGEPGYVDSKTLNAVTGGNVSNPQEAEEYMRESRKATWESKMIPVYASDGRTIIGDFEISRSS